MTVLETADLAFGYASSNTRRCSSVERDTWPRRKRATGASARPRSTPGAERHKARLSAARDLAKKRKRVAELERLVAATEAELGELRGKLRDAPGDDWEALHEWAKKEQTVARRLDEQMKDWVRSSEERPAREAAEANG